MLLQLTKPTCILASAICSRRSLYMLLTRVAPLLLVTSPPPRVNHIAMSLPEITVSPMSFEVCCARAAARARSHTHTKLLRAGGGREARRLFLGKVGLRGVHIRLDVLGYRDCVRPHGQGEGRADRQVGIL